MTLETTITLPDDPADERQDAHLRTDHLEGDLKRRSVRGGATTLSAQGIKFLLQTGSTVVLARLLSPRDYGLVGMVTVITGFVAIFKDLGLSQATVQRDQVSHRQVSTLFWINVAVSLVLVGITAALAPGIAWFYGEPRLTKITVALAGSFLLGGLTVQHHALLRRQMRFSALAMVEVIAMAFGIIVGVAAAVLGAGYWSLVCLNVGIAFASMVMAWSLSRWRPSKPQLGGGVRSMLAFGGHLTGFNVLNYFTRHADAMLIGWWHNAVALGLYTRAYQLLLMPMNQLVQPISNVVIPALSRLQNDPPRYRNYYRKALLPLVAIGIPMVVFSAVEARNLVRVMLGEKWLGVADIFLLLAPASLIGVFYVATGWVYISMGHVGRQLRWGLFSSLLTVIGFAVSVPWGPAAVAASFSIVTVVLRYPSIVYCFRGTPLAVNDLWAVLWRPATASLAAGLASLAARGVLSAAYHPGLALVLNWVLFLAAYAAAWLVLPRGWQTIREFLELARELKPRPTTAARV